ncbi:MAG: hypothetical protein RJA25_2107 [Bacteroidota bacterium]|jgi:thioredoxin-related protein
MKKIIFILLVIYTTTAMAQETGLHIEHDATWQQILDKAKQENKFILLDAYASWCGPCKWMAKEVFPKKEVGDALNPFYISAKIDMEKGEGIELAKQFEVRAYPTYLFFNSEGILVHRSLGSMPTKEFIELCQNTLKPENQFVVLKKQYETGKRDTTFLRNFAIKATDAQDSLAQPALKVFLPLVQYELSPANIQLINYMTNSLHDTGYVIMQQNLEKFTTVLGKKHIDDLKEELVWNEAKKAGKKGADKAAFKKIIQQYLPNEVNLLTAQYEISLLVRAGNWGVYLTKAEEFANKYCQNDWERLNDIANNFLENYSTKNALQKALKISLRSVEVKKNYLNLMTTAQLYQKLKDNKNAKIYTLKAFDNTTENSEERATVEEFIKTIK